MSGAVELAGRQVGAGHPALIICEAGVTNYGDVDIARRQIDAAAAAHADVVKFQLWQTEDLVSRRVAARLAPELGYDWFARLKSKELPPGALRQLQTHARDCGLIFSATAHDAASLEFLDGELDVPFFKIGSGEAHNTVFLKQVGARRKPVVISFGLQSDQEIGDAVATLRDAGAPALVVLHCVTEYPTPYPLADLGRLARLRELVEWPVGYSDHTVGRHVPLAAVALGACVIEKHLTFDKADPRSLDNPGALLPDEFSGLVGEIREIEQALHAPDADALVRSRIRARDWAAPSIVAARDIPSGAILDASMLALKRPLRGGLGAEQFDRVLGLRAVKAIAQDEQLTADAVEWTAAQER